MKKQILLFMSTMIIVLGVDGMCLQAQEVMTNVTEEMKNEMSISEEQLTQIKQKIKYDSNGNVIERVEYAYDVVGNMTRNVRYDMYGCAYTNEYIRDDNGDIVNLYQYDWCGNLLEISKRLYGKENVYQINKFNRDIIYFGEGDVTEFWLVIFDRYENIRSIWANNVMMSEEEFDNASAQIIAMYEGVTYAIPECVYEYNNCGVFEYDAEGKLIRKCDEYGDRYYFYDLSGNLIYSVDYKGGLVNREYTYQYDALGRLDMEIECTADKALDCWYKYEYFY